MVRNRKTCVKPRLRHLYVAAIASLYLPFSTFSAQAALIPPSFFDQIPATQTGQAGVEANQLVFNSETNVITADGNVGLSYNGYFSTSDHMRFNQTTRDLELTGNVTIYEPDGTKYNADKVTLTGGFKEAVLNSMVMLTADGATLTSDSTRKINGESTVLDNATYSPCGECIDEKGRRIGWRFKSTRMEQNTKEGYIDVEQPSLEILGIPIAWAPWLRLPTPDIPSGFGGPSYTYSEKIGWKISVPYYTAFNRNMGVLLTPSLISEQGLLLSSTFTHNLIGLGSYSVTGSGIYQLDPGKFNKGFGDEHFRGAIQTSGNFTPAEHWSFGWSYTTFTDTAFLTDYLIPTASPATNEVYAGYLDTNTFAEARVQEFVLLGEIAQATQDKQGRVLPQLRVNHLQDLGQTGDLRLTGELLGVDRAADDTDASNGVPYVLGHSGQKIHGYAEAEWSRQFIAGGLAITPSAGIRLDAASYNGGSALNPTASDMFLATPFATLDARYPLIAVDGGTTHVIEPIGQISYRASDITKTGITNDNAQSFTFDDSNVFSFNRFSGSDRQETGLRANIGAHYAADFEDGSYLDFIVGQSFHLAGLNALTQADAAQAGAGAGLQNDASDLVVGVRGAMGDLLTFGAKSAIDLGDFSVSKFSANANLSHSGWAFGLDYSYADIDLERGYTAVQQDIGGSLTIPLADYWSANASSGFDITAGQLINYGVGLTYDDGYLLMRADVTSSGPSLYNVGSTTYKLTLKLKGVDGVGYGYGHGFAN